MITEEEIKELLKEYLRKEKISSQDIWAIKFIFDSQNLEIDMLEQYIQNNFEYILNHSMNASQVMDELIKIGNIKEFVKEHLNKNFNSLSNIVPKKFIFESPSRYIEKNKDALNDFLKNNKNEYIKYLLTSMITDDHYDELESINEVVVMIVDEIVEHENKNYVDIEKLKTGSYSKVIQIGSKVIKVGSKRETYQIPNTSVLLQPLIRKDLSSISSFNGTIEVMEKVETRVYLSDEQLYQIYKKARDEGIILTDLKPDNVGILLKDNVLHWSKPMSDDMSNRGLDGDRKKILKVGDIVVMDSDFIYKAEDYLKKIENMKLKELNAFEKRYIFEKQQNNFKDEMSTFPNEQFDLPCDRKSSKSK